MKLQVSLSGVVNICIYSCLWAPLPHRFFINIRKWTWFFECNKAKSWMYKLNNVWMDNWFKHFEIAFRVITASIMHSAFLTVLSTTIINSWNKEMAVLFIPLKTKTKLYAQKYLQRENQRQDNALLIRFETRHFGIGSPWKNFWVTIVNEKEILSTIFSFRKMTNHRGADDIWRPSSKAAPKCRKNICIFGFIPLLGQIEIPKSNSITPDKFVFSYVPTSGSAENKKTATFYIKENDGNFANIWRSGACSNLSDYWLLEFY